VHLLIKWVKNMVVNIKPKQKTPLKTLEEYEDL